MTNTQSQRRADMSNNEGWITHDGGEMTCDPLQAIEIKLTYGMTMLIHAEEAGWSKDQFEYRLLVPKHELDSAQARIAELEAELAKARQEGYNKGVHKASEIVYFAGDELAGRLNEGEGVTVNDCENIIQECWLSIRALMKQGE